MQIKKFWRSAIAVTLFAVLVTGCGKVNASANASVADIIRQHIAEENADDEADAENKSEAGTEAEAGNRSDTESGSKLKPEKTVKFRLQRDLSILSNWKEKHTPSRSLLPQ